MSTNPFSSFEEKPEQESADLPAFARRPGALTAVCVLAIILGVLALGASCNGILAIGINSAGGFPAMIGASPKPGNEVEQIQLDMQKELAAIGNEFMVFNIVQSILVLGLGVGLLVGGIKAMRLNEQGRRMLVWTFGAALPVELIRAVVAFFVQMRMMSVTQAYMEKLVGAMPGGGDGGAEMMSFFMKSTVFAGALIGIGWLVLKLGFYVYGLLYLRRDNTRQLFEATAAE